VPAARTAPLSRAACATLHLAACSDPRERLSCLSACSGGDGASWPLCRQQPAGLATQSFGCCRAPPSSQQRPHPTVAAFSPHPTLSRCRPAACSTCRTPATLVRCCQALRPHRLGRPPRWRPHPDDCRRPSCGVGGCGLESGSSVAVSNGTAAEKLATGRPGSLAMHCRSVPLSKFLPGSAVVRWPVAFRPSFASSMDAP
jgi:hypothetical protein